MPQEQVEEYLETIYDIAGKDGSAKTTEIAGRLKVAPASVTEAFQRLMNRGLVQYDRYKGASLAPKGLKIVLRIKRRHRLLEVFLHRVLNIEKENVHDQACKMEHALFDETANALCKVLGRPTECPHGSPIPPCVLDFKSCEECLEEDVKDRQAIKVREERPVPLSSTAAGQAGKIAYILGGRHVLRKLSDMGMTPGTVIRSLRSAPFNGPIEICVRGTNIILGKNIASKVFIVIEGK